MSDTKSTGEKTLTAKPKTLSLKRPVDAGAVRQIFSQGRNKTVVVEKVKRRSVGAPADTAARAEAPVAKPKTVQTATPVAKTPSGRANRAAQPKTAASSEAPSGVVLRTLTDSEREARTKALVGAREREPVNLDGT